VSLRVVGAGLGRTGTNSLKLALERLLGAPCYHMIELFERPDDVPVWHAALHGDDPDWSAFPAGYAATVDWPACAFWAELWAASPDALVLLSTRRDAETWWRSFEATIRAGLLQPVPSDRPDWAARRVVTLEMMDAFTPDWRERDGAIAAYEAHNTAVRATVPATQLVEWRPGDGWEPLCTRLGLPAPTEDFPNVNSREEFQATQHSSEEG
jgi:Sulfotransferase domain